MRDKRLLIGLGVIVALVALFLVFRPGDDDEEGAGTTTTAVTAPPTIEPTERPRRRPLPLPKARSSS